MADGKTAVCHALLSPPHTGGSSEGAEPQLNELTIRPERLERLREICLALPGARSINPHATLDAASSSSRG